MIKRWKTQFIIEGAAVEERSFVRRVEAFDDFMGLVTHLLHLKAGMTVVLLRGNRVQQSFTA